jgi:pimeloyl-ACP methyl ester carboxylesterase
MKIYAVSGLGANEKIFEKLDLSSDFELVFISWLIPFRNESIQEYAARMTVSIDVKEEFILFGMSFGGMMAQEMAKIKPPRKLILFNTIKDETEKPFWISINNTIPLFKIFPYFLLNNFYLVKYFSKLTRLINHQCPDLSEIYTLRDRRYTAWAFDKIVKWTNTNSTDLSIFHIHGDSDFVFPYSKIKNAIRVEGGSHICVYEKSEIVSVILSKILI